MIKYIYITIAYNILLHKRCCTIIGLWAMLLLLIRSFSRIKAWFWTTVVTPSLEKIGQMVNTWQKHLSQSNMAAAAQLNFAHSAFRRPRCALNWSRNNLLKFNQIVNKWYTFVDIKVAEAAILILTDLFRRRSSILNRSHNIPSRR